MCSGSRSHPKGRPEVDPNSGKMATVLRLSASKLWVRAPKPGTGAAPVPRWTQNRTAVSTPSGAILPKPDKVSLIFSRLPTAGPQCNRTGGPRPDRHRPEPVGRLHSPSGTSREAPLTMEFNLIHVFMCSGSSREAPLSPPTGPGRHRPGPGPGPLWEERNYPLYRRERPPGS